MAYVLDDPTLAHRSAGEEFVFTVATRAADPGAGDIDVALNVVLTTVFPLAATRPRYTVRHLCRAITATTDPVPTIAEFRAEAGPEVSATTYTSTPEATFRPTLNRTAMTDVVVELEVPEGLADQPGLFAAYVDHRVIVRLCTVENETLLHGSPDGVIAGLLSLDGLRRRDAPLDLDDEIAAAAAQVEEMGGSCDGIIAHPDVYWRLLRTGMLGRLGDAGVRVSRTRMISAGQVLLGDMRAAVTLLDRGVSTLTLRRGAGADGRDVVRATQPVGLAINLPQHLVLLDLPGVV